MRKVVHFFNPKTKRGSDYKLLVDYEDGDTETSEVSEDVQNNEGGTYGNGDEQDVSFAYDKEDDNVAKMKQEYKRLVDYEYKRYQAEDKQSFDQLESEKSFVEDLGSGIDLIDEINREDHELVDGNHFTPRHMDWIDPMSPVKHGYTRLIEDDFGEVENVPMRNQAEHEPNNEYMGTVEDEWKNSYCYQDDPKNVFLNDEEENRYDMHDSAIPKVATTDRRVSHSDVVRYWRTTMRPAFRQRRGGMTNSSLRQSVEGIVKATEASHFDVACFWRTALRPSFRQRRGGVCERELKADIVVMKHLLLDAALKEYNLI